MLTKRDLGVGYLLGTGMGLIVGLLGYLLLAGPAIVNTVVAVGSAGILSGALIYVGYWLHGSGLSGDLIWRVAQYSTIGLSVPVAFGILLTVVGVQSPMAALFPGLLVNTVAAGAVIGLLFGTVQELRREHRTATELNQRNSVLNRVLRHNLRNDASVILGYVDEIRENPHSDAAEAAYETIHDRVNELIAISESARRIEHIEEGRVDGPIDVASLVDERACFYEEAYEEVRFDLELPEEAWVDADQLCASAVDNLIENAIEHTVGRPTIRIAVGSTRGEDDVEIAVADDGPGIPRDEISALSTPTESPLQHGSGLGLWVAKWVTESYGGEIRFDEADDGGTVVTLSLPAATKTQRLLRTR